MELTPKIHPVRHDRTTHITPKIGSEHQRFPLQKVKKKMMMLSKHAKPAHATFRVMSAVSLNGCLAGKPTQSHQLQQNRTILGLVPAIDKRLYRLAKGVMPPISKTEQIALGCGTIGESRRQVYAAIV